MIGKIERVKLRDVWKHEALDFTKWLENNVDVLNEALDLSLTNVEREKNAGSFSVDLVAEDENGNFVVIENQLEKSDHDHLGKVITYLTSVEAGVAIWIVSMPRPEHIRAIAWLNESSSAAFYLVKLEAIRIDDSRPAALLTLITGPSEEAIGAGKTKKEFAVRHQLRKRFWEGLLEHASPKTELHSGISARTAPGIGSGVGLPPGLSLKYWIQMHTGRAELYIDCGAGEDEKNTSIFEDLMKNKSRIEQDFGGELEWVPLEGNRACRISKTVETGGWQDEGKWSDMYSDMVDTMIKLEKVLRPFIGNLSMAD